jgi:hypothetical protein
MIVKFRVQYLCINKGYFKDLATRTVDEFSSKVSSGDALIMGQFLTAKHLVYFYACTNYTILTIITTITQFLTLGYFEKYQLSEYISRSCLSSDFRELNFITVCKYSLQLHNFHANIPCCITRRINVISPGSDTG